MTKRLWIFRVSGGEPFRMPVAGNPPMVHDGGPEVVLRCVCTEAQADELEQAIAGLGCTVSHHCPMETPEQAQERRNIMQVLGHDRPFPCVRCPECAWFDPHIDSLCGAGLGRGEGWDDDAVTGSMSNAKFQDDFDACPLREEQTQ